MCSKHGWRNFSGSSTNNHDHYEFDDPLFLHPFDNGIVSIISIKLIETENVMVWRISKLRALKGRNKLGFVDITFPKSKEDETKICKWERVNDVVCS